MSPEKIERTDLGAGAALTIENKDYSHQWLRDVNGKKVVYENCVFSASIFDRGYFHDAKFKNCKFIGTRFSDCNFRQATFDQCTFDYADFNRCIVPIPQLLANLPAHANVRWEFLHNLRANARAVGDSTHESAIVSKEIEAEIEHWRSIRRRSSGYYKKYNNFHDQWTAWYNSIRLIVERYIWGHGESLTRLFIATFVILLAVSAVHCVTNIDDLGTRSLASVPAEYFQSLCFINKLFIDLPSVSPNDVTTSPFISAFTIIIRYIVIGLAIPILYKHIAKR